MGRSIFIGDVHGCIDELEELLGVLSLSRADRLYFLGDLVDRGPASVAVVRRVQRLLRKYPESVAIAGNHEAKVLSRRDRGLYVASWANEASEDDFSFLDSLPLFHRVKRKDAPPVLVVHGGLYPTLFERYEKLGDPNPAWRRERGKRADRMRRILYVRRIDEEGVPVSVGIDGARQWSSVYDGREGFCFFGHDPQLDKYAPLVAKHAMGLDTGACFGGRLTAAVLHDGDAPQEAEIVSVSAHAQYAVPRDFDS